MLYQKYRPRTFDEVIGQDEPIKRMKILIEKINENRAHPDRGPWDYPPSGGADYIPDWARWWKCLHPWWISGLSGSGKTTLAYIIVKEVMGITVSTNGTWIGSSVPEALEVDAGSLKNIAYARDRFYQQPAVIINEAHGLKPDIRRWLLVYLEQTHKLCIFTATKYGTAEFEKLIDAKPLLSRCMHIRLREHGLEGAFAKRAREIAIEEGLDGGKSDVAYRKLVRRCDKNMRLVLNEIEMGKML